jgi:hypothetical protein
VPRTPIKPQSRGNSGSLCTLALLLVLLIIAAVVPYRSFAEETNPSSATSSTNDIESLRTLLDDSRKALASAISISDREAVVELIASLKAAQKQFALPALEAHSEELIKGVVKANDERNDTLRNLYLNGAYSLSPYSSTIAFRLLSFTSETTTPSSRELLSLLVESHTYSPEVILRGIQQLVLPVLKVLTLSLFVVHVWYLLGVIRELLSALYRLFPMRISGFLAAPIAGALLILPLFFGPLWCITIWSSLIAIVLQRRTNIPLLTGLTLLAYGVLVPASFSLSHWLNDERVTSLFRSTSGSPLLLPSDKSLIATLLNEASFTGVAQLGLAHHALSEGSIHTASDYLGEIQSSQGSEAWLIAQQCIVKYVAEGAVAAKPLCKDAYEKGYRSVDFLYHYSQIQFALLEGEESRALFEEAQRIDSGKARAMMAAERDYLTPLPPLIEAPTFFMMTRWWYNHLLGVKEGDNYLFTMMRGGSGLLLTALGITLLVVSIILRSRLDNEEPLLVFERQEMPSPLRSLIGLLPGAGLALAQRPAAAACVVLPVLTLAYPLLSKSHGIGLLLSYLGGPSFFAAYTVGFVVVVILLRYLTHPKPRYWKN